MGGGAAQRSRGRRVEGGAPRSPGGRAASVHPAGDRPGGERREEARPCTPRICLRRRASVWGAVCFGTAVIGCVPRLIALIEKLDANEIGIACAGPGRPAHGQILPGGMVGKCSDALEVRCRRKSAGGQVYEGALDGGVVSRHIESVRTIFIKRVEIPNVRESIRQFEL